MSFVYPQFLWALGTLAIPVIVHLFNFRKVKRVYFSNVHLLKAVQTQTNSFRTLRQLLIMLARLLALACLVLAFAQPFLSSPKEKTLFDQRGVVSIYLDNSYSMQSERARRKQLDWAKESIGRLTKVFPKTTSFQLITNDFLNKEQYPGSASQLEDRLAETNFSARTRNLESVYTRQKSLLERMAPQARNQVFWFSDFQQSTAGPLGALQLDTLNYYHIVPLKTDKTPNIAVDSVWLENPFIKELEQNTLGFTIKNFSEQPYEDLIIKLFIEELQVATAGVTLAANGKASGTFSFVVQGRGPKKCRITFEETPVVFDNEYYFTLNVAPKINILHLFQDASKPYIQGVYGSETSFGLTNLNNLDARLLEQSDLLVIDGFSGFSPTIEEAVEKFIQNGGTTVVFPPESPSLENYSSVLSKWGVRGLQFQKNDSLGKNNAKTLFPPDVNNPFFQGIFEKTPTQVAMPYANAVLSWLSGSHLLNFRNGKPFLSEFRRGKGRLFLFAAPLNQRYSDFGRNALFVPVMYKIASGSKSQSGKLSYGFQEKNISFKVPINTANQVFKLKGKNGEFIPAQRIIGDQLSLELPEQTLEAGYYELVSDKTTTPLAILAFNHAKEESEMKFYSLEELRKSFGSYKNLEVYESLESADFINEFKNRNLGTPLWKYFLWAALGFLLVEILLIRLMGQKIFKFSVNQQPLKNH